MSDIVIIKGRNRAVIIGETAKGRDWMKNNIINIYAHFSIMIDAELAEEMAESICKDNVEVEIR